jgi:hypothetical protein
VNRRIVAVLSVLLIIVQMMALPFTQASGAGLPGTDCSHAGTVHSWHPEHCADEVTGGGSPSSQHHPAAHHCRCVHAVPSLGLVAVSQMTASPLFVETAAVVGRLPGPAYPAPLFDLLRPPN